ncbi:MAG: hypothetical protein FJX53_08690 [Alphaproteobacteria bacterium]|nr:hypothetical protein [Alphaproteobacteria bacterium]
MPVTTKYIFFAQMDVTPEKEALFNEVYDLEHIPALMKVPGVRAIWRGKAEDFAMFLGGEKREMKVGDNPTYLAAYELDSPDVLLSKEWAAGTEVGRWPTEVRPYCSNRRQVMRKIVSSS